MGSGHNSQFHSFPSSLLKMCIQIRRLICFSCSIPFVSGIQEILKVRLGEYDVSTTAEPLPHEEFDVSDIQIHPDFNNATLVNDIALVRLVRRAKRKQNIDVVCVGGSEEKELTDCVVTGWGRRSEGEKTEFSKPPFSLPQSLTTL